MTADAVAWSPKESLHSSHIVQDLSFGLFVVYERANSLAPL